MQVGAWCLQATERRARRAALGRRRRATGARSSSSAPASRAPSACQVAVGVGAHVSHPRRQPDEAPLRARHPRRPRDDRRCRTAPTSRKRSPRADLVIGTVLIPGAQGAEAASRASLVRGMRRGAALVDVSIDQGGCAETSRPTTHARPDLRRGGRRPLLRHQHAGRRAAHRRPTRSPTRRSPTRSRSPTTASTAAVAPIRRCAAASTSPTAPSGIPASPRRSILPARC